MKNETFMKHSATLGAVRPAFYDSESGQIAGRLFSIGANLPRTAVIGLILMVALLAFEAFNFDTTRFALLNLLGDVRFAGLHWASILAVAFCAIDFAGLVRFFSPTEKGEQNKEVIYLMGAWLLGATMNAMMTWWAISLTLLNHDFGNEVLNRETLLSVVPIFVAVLVWLTRILFIGAFTVAGARLFGGGDDQAPSVKHSLGISPAAKGPLLRSASIPLTTDEVPGFLKQRATGSPQPVMVKAAANSADRSGRIAAELRPIIRHENEAPQKSNGLHKSAPSHPVDQPQPQTSARIRQRPPMPKPNLRRDNNN